MGTGTACDYHDVAQSHVQDLVSSKLPPEDVASNIGEDLQRAYDYGKSVGRIEEREACAEVADAYRREDNTILVSAAEYIATRIRARGTVTTPKRKDTP